LILNNLEAQNYVIEGVVKDLQNGQPIKKAQVFVNNEIEKSVITDENGKFRIENSSKDSVVLHIQMIGYENFQKNYVLKSNEPRFVFAELHPKSNFIKEVDIKSQRKAKLTMEEISTQKIEVKTEQVNPSGNIENLLKFQGLGVGGNNELGSQYNVRGGSFDENLVYVNDYEVYRPQLIRSAQQEGLSFANSNLVNNMKFSSGGFKAEYGDKLSSVLDIEYKKPKKWGGSIEAGLMGINAHLEGNVDNDFTWLSGFRYRDNSYLLSSQETKGVYQPQFLDFQNYITYKLHDAFTIDWLVNVSSNRFKLIPADRQTNFGLVNFALTYRVKYDGLELDKYSNFMNGFGMNLALSPNFKLRYSNSYYYIDESQTFDIQGQYSLGEIETDVNSSNYQNFKSVLGAGGFQNWGRDRYQATMSHNTFSGNVLLGKHNLKFGYTNKSELLKMYVNEWDRVDSADYNIPAATDNIIFPYVAKANTEIKGIRHEFYLQESFSKDLDSSRRIGFTIGLRGNYWNVNKEWFISPRFQAFYMPLKNKRLTLNMAVGSYNQQPFFRELLNEYAVLNTSVKSQKSLHYIAGAEYIFKWFGRPFKFTSEAYYKHLWDVNTYQYNNVLVRYKANNQTIAYAKGIDLRLNGEVVKNAESWVNISFMDTKEYTGDIFTKYVDSLGNAYINPNSSSAKIVDSFAYDRGFIPRQSNQFFTLNMYYQDYFPRFPNYKVHLSFIYASGLPFGPPNSEINRNTFTMTPYKRLDIGFSATLRDEQKINEGAKPFLKAVKSIWATVEIFNILDFENQVGVSWIRDFDNNQFAVPNNLTGRRINARMVFKF
jgi:hypothetical protein